MAEQVIHTTLNSRYRIVFEQAASTKGVIGFKVEANGDDFEDVSAQAEALLIWAKGKCPNNAEVK